MECLMIQTSYVWGKLPITYTSADHTGKNFCTILSIQPCSRALILMRVSFWESQTWALGWRSEIKYKHEDTLKLSIQSLQRRRCTLYLQRDRAHNLLYDKKSLLTRQIEVITFSENVKISNNNKHVSHS